jgi:hypothetical protein
MNMYNKRDRWSEFLSRHESSLQSFQEDNYDLAASIVNEYINRSFLGVDWPATSAAFENKETCEDHGVGHWPVLHSQHTYSFSSSNRGFVILRETLSVLGRPPFKEDKKK